MERCWNNVKNLTLLNKCLILSNNIRFSMSFWRLSNELKNSAKEPKINTLILCIRQKFNNTLWLKICYFAVHVTLCSRLHLLVKVVGIYVKTYLHTILNLHLIDFQTSIKFVWNIKMTYFLPYQPKKWAIFHEKKVILWWWLRVVSKI